MSAIAVVHRTRREMAVSSLARSSANARRSSEMENFDMMGARTVSDVSTFADPILLQDEIFPRKHNNLELL
jgi:hypothetical protein